MACIKTRGPKNATRYYASYDVGRTADGKRVMRMHLLKGVRNMPQAREELGRVEHELAARRDPFPGPAIVPSAVKPLMETWRETRTSATPS